MLRLSFVVSTLFLVSCTGKTDNSLVVYVSLDREFSEPILEAFEKETGIDVVAKYDVESTKTVGLANRILEEKAAPNCDLFWNNEIMHTLRLDAEGCLRSAKVERGKFFSESFRSPDGRWFGFAGRARVFLFNTEKLDEDADKPTTILDLANPKWKGKVAIAKPLFGTTATHAAVLYATLGKEKAKEFFVKVKENCVVLSGNKQVAMAVASGEVAWGLTDTDDAVIELEKGGPVEIFFPDQALDEMGCLMIPNTLAPIAKSKQEVDVDRLMDYLLSAEVETRLLNGASSQFPLGRDVKARPRIFTGPTPRWMFLDFRDAAKQWETSQADLVEIFQRAE